MLVYAILVYYCGAKRGTGQNVAHLQIKKNIKGAEEISKYAKYWIIIYKILNYILFKMDVGKSIVEGAGNSC